MMYDLIAPFYDAINSELDYSLWADFIEEIVKREYFGEGTKATFEGLEVVIPEKYDEFLTSIYGNYMKLPPLEKQVGKHNHAGYSLTIPYNEFKKNYKKGK